MDNSLEPIMKVFSEATEKFEQASGLLPDGIPQEDLDKMTKEEKEHYEKVVKPLLKKKGDIMGVIQGHIKDFQDIQSKL